jgi:hypothetical protein
MDGIAQSRGFSGGIVPSGVMSILLLLTERERSTGCLVCELGAIDLRASTWAAENSAARQD